MAVLLLAALFAQLPCAIRSCSTLPVAFGQHQLLVSQPQGRHRCTSCPVGRCCNVLGSEEPGVKISTSCSKSPKPARTRSVGFACCLSWVMTPGTFPGSSARCPGTAADPWGPAECGSCSCSSTGSMKAAVQVLQPELRPAVTEPGSGCP